MYLFQKSILTIIISLLFASLTLGNQNRWDFGDIIIPDNGGGWDSTKGYTGGEVIEHGDFNGTPMYWTNAWWVRGIEPGGIVDSGGENPWGLINTLAFAKGEEYEWVGWNSYADKYVRTHDNSWNFTMTKVGDWGPQISMKGPGAYLPTYRDGAEGVYTIIHEGLGRLDYDLAIKNANEVGYDHPRVRVGWSATVSEIDETDWESARDMVIDRHEVLNGSLYGNPVGSLWQWFFHGDTLDNQDPFIPAEIKNLVVDSIGSGWSTLDVKVPSISFIDGDYLKPETTYTVSKYQVADYEFKIDSTFNPDLSEYEYEYVSTGKIKAEHVGWSYDVEAAVSMLKVFCLTGWDNSSFKVNIKDANDLINENIYDHISSSYWPKGKQCEYYVFPSKGAFSQASHDSLQNYGIIGSCGGIKSGTPLPGDLYHPFRIDYDEFYLMNADGSKVNPYQRIGLDEMLDVIYQTKGYMIRKFEGVYDDNWLKFEDVELPKGGIPKSLYKSHFEKIDEMIDDHKIAVMTPSEAVKYRLTANSVTKVSIEENGGSTSKLTVNAEGCPPEYQDEISVIVKLEEAQNDLYARYPSGKWPRLYPKKMDAEGKVWSVSINPYIEGGIINLHGPTSIGSIGFGDLLNNKFINSVNKMHINLKLPRGDFNIEIYSLNGKTIFNKVINGDGNIKTVNFKRVLAPGNYFVKISDGQNNIKRKILIK